MTIPSSRSLILWISVFSITSPSADFGRLRKTSNFFGIFGNDRVVFKNPSTPRIKISRLYLRKSWQVSIKMFTIRCTTGKFNLHVQINLTLCYKQQIILGPFMIYHYHITLNSHCLPPPSPSAPPPHPCPRPPECVIVLCITVVTRE